MAKPPAHTEVVLGERPHCDLCRAAGKRVPASVDAALPKGPWAFMCEAHFEMNGASLGLGRGQRIIVDPI